MMDRKETGFFNPEKAADHVRAMRRQRSSGSEYVLLDPLEIAHRRDKEERRDLWRRGIRPAPPPRRTWRDIERLYLPVWLIERGTGALTHPLGLGTRALIDWLERLVEAHDAASFQGRYSQLGPLLSLARWLIEAPNSAHQPTPSETSHDPFWRSKSHPDARSGREVEMLGGRDHE